MKELNTTGDVESLFGNAFTKQTVRKWTRDFEEYFSEYAVPKSGDQRLYTPEDLRVIAYIHEQRDKYNKPIDTIKTELAAGNRGEVSQTPSVRIESELEQVIQERDALKMELDMIRVRMATAESLVQEYRTRLEKETEDSKQTYAELNQEIGKLRGMIEILKGDMGK